jgi:predicted nucleotidyltransferase
MKTDDVFLPIDEYGYFINNLNTLTLDSEWFEAVNYFIHELCSNLLLKSKIHSIYLRGSVTSNTAVKYYSDIDFIIILFENFSKNELKEIALIRKFGKVKFTFVSNFEYNLVCISSLTLNKNNYLFFFVKVLSICLWGLNLQNNIAKYRISVSIFSQVPFLKYSLEKNLTMIKNCKYKKEKIFFLKSLSKRLLRASFELVTIEEQKYTRDVLTAGKYFLKYYPNKNKEIEKINQIAYNQNIDIVNDTTFLELFANWIIHEFKTKPNDNLEDWLKSGSHQHGFVASGG